MKPATLVMHRTARPNIGLLTRSSIWGYPWRGQCGNRYSSPLATGCTIVHYTEYGLRKECLFETMLLYNAHIYMQGVPVPTGRFLEITMLLLSLRGPLRQHNELTSQQFSLLSLLPLPLPTQHAYSHSLPRP